jgi:hypothetical protein
VVIFVVSAVASFLAAAVSVNVRRPAPTLMIEASPK